jgi:hypothetical protein
VFDRFCTALVHVTWKAEVFDRFCTALVHVTWKAEVFDRFCTALVHVTWKAETNSKWVWLCYSTIRNAMLLNEDLCLQILKQNAAFQKQICFFPQCALFYAPDSTQPIKYKQWDKYGAMFKYSVVQIPSLSHFPIYLSSIYSSNLEWK